MFSILCIRILLAIFLSRCSFKVNQFYYLNKVQIVLVQLSPTNRHNSNGNNHKIKQKLCVCIIYLNGLDYRILHCRGELSSRLCTLLFSTYFFALVFSLCVCVSCFPHARNTFKFTANVLALLYLVHYLF